MRAESGCESECRGNRLDIRPFLDIIQGTAAHLPSAVAVALVQPVTRREGLPPYLGRDDVIELTLINGEVCDEACLPKQVRSIEGGRLAA